MLGGQRVLLIWGTVLLLVVLAASLFLGPKAETAPELVKSAHGHAIGLALVVIAMGLLQPHIKMSDGVRWPFGVLLGFGATFLPVGVLVQLASKGTGAVIAMMSAIFVVVSVFVFTVGLIVRAVSPELS